MAVQVVSDSWLVNRRLRSRGETKQWADVTRLEIYKERKNLTD